MSLYGLYRKLFVNTSRPDKSFFKQLWEMQKKCVSHAVVPCTTHCGYRVTTSYSMCITLLSSSL